MEKETKGSVSERVCAMRAAFLRDGAASLQERRVQLRRLKEAIQRHEQALYDALWTELHKSPQEAFLTEVGFVLQQCDRMIRSLGRWQATRRVCTPLFLFGSRSYVRREPYGVVAVLSPWNYPFQLALAPLIGAVAAGNRVVLKPSERTPRVNAVIRLILDEVFTPDSVWMVEGDAAVAIELLAAPPDYIFFTGGAVLGRRVMEQAARALIPLTLELGGKSPCVVDREADLRIAARRIVWGKFLNAGQTCVAPDYLWVHRCVKQEFIALLKKEIVRAFGEDPSRTPFYGRMIGSGEVERMRHLMQDGTIIQGGVCDAEERYVAPTLLEGVSLESPLMQEEIFGPLLPILSFEDLSTEVVVYLQRQPKPLALYYFGRKATGTAFFDRVDSGGGCINDVLLHLANDRLPFGGVGQSGFGAYHGRYSFETFSRLRSLLITPVVLDFPMKYPPYRGFSWLKRLFVK